MDTSLEAGLQELEMATFGAVQGALDATGLKANEVGTPHRILIAIHNKRLVVNNSDGGAGLDAVIRRQ
jgi:hypothetical protein